MTTRGRPREFDREAALRRAMNLFWRHGYEGTSISQLGRAMGVTSPSLYAAFGSKEDLYRESLELYIRTNSAPAMQVLDSTPHAKEAIENLLRTLARQFVAGPDQQRGCMIAGGDLVCAPENVKLGKDMGGRRALAEAAIRARLKRAAKDQQLKRAADAEALAAYFAAVIQGMSVQARDGASLSRLNSIISLAMKAWPTQRSRGRKAARRE